MGAIRIIREADVTPTEAQQLTADTIGRGDWRQTDLSTHGVTLEQADPKAGSFVEVRHYHFNELPRVCLSVTVVDVPHERLTELVERFEAEATRIYEDLCSKEATKHAG